MQKIIYFWLKTIFYLNKYILKKEDMHLKGLLDARNGAIYKIVNKHDISSKNKKIDLDIIRTYDIIEKSILKENKKKFINMFYQDISIGGISKLVDSIIKEHGFYYHLLGFIYISHDKILNKIVKNIQASFLESSTNFVIIEFKINISEGLKKELMDLMERDYKGNCGKYIKNNYGSILNGSKWRYEEYNKIDIKQQIIEKKIKSIVNRVQSFINDYIELKIFKITSLSPTILFLDTDIEYGNKDLINFWESLSFDPYMTHYMLKDYIAINYYNKSEWLYYFIYNNDKIKSDNEKKYGFYAKQDSYFISSTIIHLYFSLMMFNHYKKKVIDLKRIVKRLRKNRLKYIEKTLISIELDLRLALNIYKEFKDFIDVNKLENEIGKENINRKYYVLAKKISNEFKITMDEYKQTKEQLKELIKIRFTIQQQKLNIGNFILASISIIISVLALLNSEHKSSFDCMINKFLSIVKMIFFQVNS